MANLFNEIYDYGFYDDSVINAVFKNDSNSIEVEENVANESELGFIMIASTNSKVANKYFSSAKKRFKYGDKEGALKLMYDARKLYEKCLQQAYASGSKNKKEIKLHELSGASTKISNIGFRGDIRYKEPKKFNKIYLDNSINIAIRYFKLKINRCDVHIMAFKNEIEEPKFKELSKEIDKKDKELKEAYKMTKNHTSDKIKKYIEEHIK